MLWLVPPLLLVSGLVGFLGKELLGVWPAFGVLVLVVPYLQLGWDLRHAIGEAVIKERAIKLIRDHCQNADKSEKPSSSVIQIEDNASVVKMDEISCVVRTVTSGVESYYVVFNLGATVHPLKDEEAVRSFGLTKRSTGRAKSDAPRST
jgi:hypothetical protein